MPQSYGGSPMGVGYSPSPAGRGYSGYPGLHAQPQPAGPPAVSPSIDRLSKVRSSLNQLSETLNADIGAKREFEENRIYEVRELTGKIEKHLAMEVKRRAEQDKALQSMFEQRMQDMQDSMRREFTERSTQQQLNIDILTKKMVAMERDVAVERERSAQLLQRLDQGMSEEVKGLRATLDQEKVHRMEKEAQLLRKCAEDIYRLQERLDVEKHAREVGLDGLREAIGRLSEEKTKDDDKFKTMIISDVEQLKSAVRYEHEEREQAEEQITQTMDQMVQQVQDALRVVSK